MQRLKRPVFLAIGWLSLLLGIFGIIFPLFPSAPFLLVAIWAFSRSSPELAERIRQNRLAGPYIRDWQDAGVVPPKAKLTAMVMIAAMMAYGHFFGHLAWWAESLGGAALLAAAAFILTRPGARPGA